MGCGTCLENVIALAVFDAPVGPSVDRNELQLQMIQMQPWRRRSPQLIKTLSSFTYNPMGQPLQSTKSVAFGTLPLRGCVRRCDAVIDRYTDQLRDLNLVMSHSS